MSNSLDDIQRVEAELAALGDRIEALSETPAEPTETAPPSPHQMLAEGLNSVQSTWFTIGA